MPAVLKFPTEKKVLLNLPTHEDPEQDTYVVVRQATQQEMERRADMNTSISRTYREGTKSVEVKGGSSMEEQRRVESYLTLSDCNIALPVVNSKGEDTGEYEPAFKFRRIDGMIRVDMTPDQFSRVWGRLPSHWAKAIHDAVLTVNRQWDADAEGE